MPKLIVLLLVGDVYSASPLDLPLTMQHTMSYTQITNIYKVTKSIPQTNNKVRAIKRK